MNLAEYANHDATGLAGLVQRGEVTAAELAALARQAFEKVDPAINAVVEFYADAETLPGPDEGAFAERGGYEVVEVFRETASGMKANRSARNQVMKLAQARHIDAILVTELSRWGRSTQDLLDTLNRLSGWRVSVVGSVAKIGGSQR